MQQFGCGCCSTFSDASPDRRAIDCTALVVARMQAEVWFVLGFGQDREALLQPLGETTNSHMFKIQA